MSLKFTTPSAAVKLAVDAEIDLVSAAQEACDICHDIILAEGNCKEIADVLNDIMFVRDTIKKHGIRSYYYNVDKSNSFAAAFDLPTYVPGLGLAMSRALESQYIAAAEEGLKVWWTKFVEMLKNLWAKFTAWIQTTFSLRNHYIEKLKKGLDKFDKLDTDKSADIMSKDSAENVIKAVKRIHEVIGKLSSPPPAKELFAELDVMMAGPACEEVLKKVGYEVVCSKENQELYISEADSGLSDMCPIESKKISEHGWDSSSAKKFAQDIADTESRSSFKDNAEKCQKLVRSLHDEFLKDIARKSPETDEAKDKLDATHISVLKGCNQSVRCIYKLEVIENKLMTRACKTAIALMEATKSDK